MGKWRKRLACGRIDNRPGCRSLGFNERCLHFHNSALLMILFRKKRIPTTMLGLTLTAGRLEGVLVRRSNGSMQVQKTLSAALALNPLTSDPELVGREIRNHLEQAGIRERRCVVCLPLSWALTLSTEVPDMPNEDMPGFLEIEAERGFPFGLEALSIGRSLYRSVTGKSFATQVAIPRNHLEQVERSLKAAQLRATSFTLGISVHQVPEKDSSHGVLALVLDEASVDAQVTCAGGVVVMRSLDGVFESEGVQSRLSTDLLLREIKITLGQLPADFRDSVRRVRVFGRSEPARRFVSESAQRLQLAGMKVELVEAYAPNEFSKSLPAGVEVSPAFSAAARCVTGLAPLFEFLPPKISAVQQLTSRFASKKLGWIGAAAAALLLLVGGAFAVQQFQLSRLRSQWAGMEKNVRELEDMQAQIRRFRPWFDSSFRNLTVLKKITEAFPENGVVTAKTLEIRDVSSVTCSGVASDNQALLKMLDQLRAAKDVRDLKVDNIRGKTPLQFTFNFHWGEGGGDGN